MVNEQADSTLYLFVLENQFDSKEQIQFEIIIINKSVVAPDTNQG